MLPLRVQSEPGSDVNDGVLLIHQISEVEASASDCLISYPGHSWGRGSYSSAEMQLVYSIVPAD